MSPEDRLWYDQNDRDIIARRAIFERDLVTFARLAYPRIVSHRIRRIFSDL